MPERVCLMRGSEITKLKLFICSLLLFLTTGSVFGQTETEQNQFVARPVATAQPKKSFEWKGALIDASIFLGIQQTFRLAQDPMVRHGLRGPFFQNYADSVGNISGWNDGDSFTVNYVGHPVSGAVTGFIEVYHDPRYRLSKVGTNNQYFKSRMRA